ncbi:hypothetical protein L228DRAFT_236892 [Xylona heveae TC161]|uniref:Uncharacterized protein n=1 Tax=Xylona heveae (strain CBS 132557 / TC161) TaxID=1328760 RepID=A0A165J7F6_XYLHT|nr:hypothetical protein L228DRAFT_236892 [Xylona heveae TC161]KZF25844.1 hypothetical protein L228DRAFT_236892 [Xylona heveae TC161]
MGKSFGIHEEHHVSWTLFQGLQRHLHWKHPANLKILLKDCPLYAWAVQTKVYLNYLWHTTNKFTTGFKVIYIQCHPDFVTWEQMKIMAMFLCCLCFQFQADMLHGVEAKIEPEHWQAALEANQPFCYKYFDSIMCDEVYLASGNCSGLKKVKYLFTLLWDYNDGKQRDAVVKDFHAKHKHIFYLYHWILPYPNEMGLLQKTKQGQCMWYLISIASKHDHHGCNFYQTAWEKTNYKAGFPNLFPQYCLWTKEEWELWMECYVEVQEQLLDVVENLAECLLGEELGTEADPQSYHPPITCLLHVDGTALVEGSHGCCGPPGKGVGGGMSIAHLLQAHCMPIMLPQMELYPVLVQVAYGSHAAG